MGDFNFDLAPVESSDLFTDDKKNDSESYSLILQDFLDLGQTADQQALSTAGLTMFFYPGRIWKLLSFNVLYGKVVRECPIILCRQDFENPTDEAPR